MKAAHCSVRILPAVAIFGLILGGFGNNVDAATPAGSYQLMLGKLRAVKTYQVTIKDTTVLQPTGQGAKARTIQSTDQVSFQSPNLFCLKNDGLMGGASIISNGTLEYFYSDLSDEYASRQAPKDVVGNIAGGLQGKTVTWTAVTATSVDGVPVKQLTGFIDGSRGKTLVTLSIRQSDLLPYELRLVLPKFSSANGDGLQITRTELFTNQRLNEPLPGSIFQFTPPSGSTKVDSPSDLASGFDSGAPG